MALRPWRALLGMARHVDAVNVPYYAVLKCWIAAFGPGTASVRVPSVLVSLLALWPFSRAAARLAGERAALFATAVLAFSTIDLVYALEARGYALEFCALAFATWALLAITDGRRGAAVGYACAASAAMWFHLLAALLLIAQVIAVPLLRPSREALRRVALGAVAAGLGVAPLVGAAITESAGLAQIDWVPATDPRLVRDVPYWLLGGWIGGRLDGPWLPSVLAVIIACAALASRRAAVPFAWLALSFGSAVLASLAHPLLVFRYLRFELIPLAMLAGIGVDVAAARRGAPAVAALVAVLATAGMVQSATAGFADWRRIDLTIAGGERPGDVLVAEAPYGIFPYRAGLRDVGIAGPPVAFPRAVDEGTWRVPLTATEALRIAAAHRGIWVVLLQPRKPPVSALDVLLAAYPTRWFHRVGSVTVLEARR